MSRIERVPLKCEALSMKIRGSINIPEVAVPPSTEVPLTPSLEELPSEPPPFSPTSEDSGRWTGTALWPSTKYFVYGSPGFSIGILDSTTGSLEQLPVPVPTLSFLEAADASNFSLSEVTTLSLAGECQVWAGTETGSLHVFDLTPGPRLSNHGYSKLPDPVLCLRTEPLVPGRDATLSSKERLPLMRTEVLVGSSNNTLTVISGEADERGGLRNVARCPRKVLQLGRSFEGDESKNNGVRCIALVSSLAGALEECYWCGCGPSIVILRRSNWKVLKVLDKFDGLASVDTSGDAMCVSQLEATEFGVWCSVLQSPTMLLWDAKDFTLKMKISCFNAGPETALQNKNAQVTCLVYSEPLLLVGTQGGHLLVFCIHKRHSVRRPYRTRHNSIPDTAIHSLPASPKLALRSSGWGMSTVSRKLDYTPVSSTHCCARPIISIHPIAMQGSMCSAGSPYLPSPSHSLNMLVVFGASEDDTAQSMVHLYEITNSPQPSPLTSPQSVPVGRLSTTSTQSLPGSTSRCSLQDLKEMPKLSITRVSKGAISYLPLHENSAW